MRPSLKHQPDRVRGETGLLPFMSTSANDEHLMEPVVDHHNIMRALARVKQNGGNPGIDGMTVEDLPGFLIRHWSMIRESLLKGTYKPHPVKRVEIPKRGGRRLLGIPTVVDRLIQQAVLQVLQPEWDTTFSDFSYGFRPNRSAHDAVVKAQEYLRQEYGWVVDLDLEKFFDRVNHDKLMSLVTARIRDTRVITLIRRYLKSGVLIGEMYHETHEGTPQGGPLSPLLANLLLDLLDKELERRGLHFVRYADDCVPRRLIRVRRSHAVEEMREGPSEPACRSRFQITLRCVELKAPGGERQGKGLARRDQMRTMKTNVNEPLLTCRKRRNDVETRTESLFWDKSGRNLSTDRTASGMKAA